MVKKTKTVKGEQLQLIDVGPENLKAIVKEVRIYKEHQTDRLVSLKKEVDQKEKVRKLVEGSGLKRLQDGTIRFEAAGAVICIAPQEDLITIKEKATKKSKKGKK